MRCEDETLHWRILMPFHNLPSCMLSFIDLPLRNERNEKNTDYRSQRICRKPNNKGDAE